MKTELLIKNEKKYFIALSILLSSLTTYAGIRDSSCAIAVPHSSTTIADYTLTQTMEDTALQGLVNRGYSPYRGGSYNGLILYWSYSTGEHWYGDSITYTATVKRATSNGEVLLGTSSSSSSFKDAFESLPRCVSN